MLHKQWLTSPFLRGIQNQKQAGAGHKGRKTGAVQHLTVLWPRTGEGKRATQRHLSLHFFVSPEARLWDADAAAQLL